MPMPTGEQVRPSFLLRRGESASTQKTPINKKKKEGKTETSFGTEKKKASVSGNMRKA